MNFNELIPVTQTTIKGKSQQVVSARQLYFCLGVRRDFTTWIKGRIEKYGFKQIDDFLIIDTPKRGDQSTKNEQSKKWQTIKGGDRKSTDYILTISTAKELAMIENNEHGRAVRKYFIRCEELLREQAPKLIQKELKRLKERVKVADYGAKMSEALEASRKAQGKQTDRHHFINEYRLINKLVLGTSTKNFKKANSIFGDVRDHLNEQELRHLSYLEASNITLLDMGLTYEQRKEQLTRLSDNYLRRLIGNAA